MDDYIYDLLGPVRAEEVIKAMQILSSFNVFSTYPTLNEIAMDDVNFDEYSKAQEMIRATKDDLIEVLQAHQVLVDMDTPLVMLNNITFMLFESVNSYDPSYITDQVDLEVGDGNTPIDIIAGITALLYQVDPLEMLDYITFVDPDLPNKISDALGDKEVPPIPYVDKVHLDNYRQFLAGRRRGLVYELINQGAIVVGKYDALVIEPLIDEHLDGLSVDDLVFEMASIALVGNNPITPKLVDTLSVLASDNEATIARVKAKLTTVLEDYYEQGTAEPVS